MEGRKIHWAFKDGHSVFGKMWLKVFRADDMQHFHKWNHDIKFCLN